MEVLDELLLGYVLKKLTDVFEEIVTASKNTSSNKPADLVVAGARQRKAAPHIPNWLGRLKVSTPYHVTRVLSDQMQIAQKLEHVIRLEAQTTLLEALVEEGLAIDLVSYATSAPGKACKGNFQLRPGL